MLIFLSSSNDGTRIKHILNRTLIKQTYAFNISVCVGVGGCVGVWGVCVGVRLSKASLFLLFREKNTRTELMQKSK